MGKTVSRRDNSDPNLRQRLCAIREERRRKKMDPRVKKDPARRK